MLYIYLKSYDIDLLNYFIKEILLKNKKFTKFFDKIVLKGPINLPKKTKKYTVIRSPHVYSLSREQFEVSTFRRLLVLKTKKSNFLENNKTSYLLSFYQVFIKNLPFGISIKLIVKPFK